MISIAIVLFLAAAGYWIARISPRLAPGVVVAFGVLLVLFSVERAAVSRAGKGRQMVLEKPIAASTVAPVFREPKKAAPGILLVDGRVYWIVPARVPQPAKPSTY